MYISSTQNRTQRYWAWKQVRFILSGINILTSLNILNYHFIFDFFKRRAIKKLKYFNPSICIFNVHVAFTRQLADILTKALERDHFHKLVSKLGIYKPSCSNLFRVEHRSMLFIIIVSSSISYLLLVVNMHSLVKSLSETALMCFCSNLTVSQFV